MERWPHFCECGDHVFTPLTRGHIGLLSPEDAHYFEKPWCAVQFKPRASNYATRKENGVVVRLHQLIARGFDHRNRNGLDNRRSNLRPASKAQQQFNRGAWGRSSKFKGVSFNKKWRKWFAYCQTPVGYFDSEEAAALARDAQAVKIAGEFAVLNFPVAGELTE